MANDLNQCNFIGRLGKAPEVRYLSNGTAACNFTIAVGWKGKDKEGTEWVRISAFGKLAEICGEYLGKGSRVFISGKFRTREWEKDGQKHYMSEIVADQMQMLDTRGEGGRPSNASNQQPGDGFEDDIPF